ncbi:HAM-2, protein required for hyphal anastomosis [Heterobasidion irregulare TC 32-1]|uniref:HAM-2, protein required for hyphal anastomosis n=1 Tax=Heterobasidion irregulare (strain TC 32-1) TaxID=747525 RepID=W4KDH7_HETIT|nr:HAM-2, protein required for hyphal anastomosis [Heterobasidion irregulare TC 32-1]ETW83843.1 HAM-2, protein required for hyphal anastomosis [Heterobasidion irregulare TC 32-1]
MQSYYDFKYDDEDTVLNEIEEFYSYVEMPQVEENAKAWVQGTFEGEWIKSSISKRKAHVEFLLERLEHKDAEARFTHARRLLYILQGEYSISSCGTRHSNTTSPEHQLHWIFENCKVVRAANGLSNIVEAMKIASSKLDMLYALPDAEAAQSGISLEAKAELMEEFTTEIYVYLAMLYHLIETLKGHDDFADELMSLDPPLPVYFFNVVSGLRDKSAKGYPVKKLLLVLWKTLLSCCGGIRDLARVKKLSRELAGLAPIPDEAVPIKSSPLDIEAFRQEISVKYPTFSAHPASPTAAGHEPQALPSIPIAKLAEAYTPIPIRPHYHHEEPESQHPGHSMQHYQPSQMHSGFRGVPQPATPAPTPPPSPKPKKQQYQTDPSRPFLFPFSRRRDRGRDMMLVPFAIEEADKLYNKHMYVSLPLWQMWKMREECMTAESGLDHLPGMEGVTDSMTRMTTEEALDTEIETLHDVALLDAKIAETEAAIQNAESTAESRQLKQRREDLLRLKRVEQIYSAVLPVLSNWVLVLLKLLLSIVSASSPNQPPPSAGGSSFPPGVSSQSPSHAIDPGDIDVTRHREVTTKAVSAILLLTLKWFKASHVMKFHHLGQLLLDTNCLLLVMKMFGLQDVSASIVSKAESPNNNFFRYCLLRCSKNPQLSHTDDHMLSQPRRTVTRITVLPNGLRSEEDVDMLTEFSWRNFFSSINFTKVMQKLSKHRSNRIRMLVQYKSSAVLKRILKVQHPMLQLHILKLIKSQVPFSGRKWRQSNMQVITSIYLNCRPDLRDEWLTGNEVDEVGEGQAQEEALRQLVKFYNTKRYGQPSSHPVSHTHRRSVSMSHTLESLHGSELQGLVRPVGTPNVVEADVFPPLRAQAPDPNIFLPYITEDIAFEEEYEEYLSDLGWSDSQPHVSDGPPISSSRWHRLPDFASDLADGISDSESIVSIGELGDEGRDTGRDDRESTDANLNNWEHMSPKTMAALTKSPARPGVRRSSSGEKLRPVIPFGLDEANLAEGLEDEDDGEDLGPMPREQSGPFASGGGVDEVEYAYGV